MEAEGATDLALPPEMLERVFSSLNLQDLKASLQVCRRWREAGGPWALGQGLPQGQQGEHGRPPGGAAREEDAAGQGAPAGGRGTGL